VDYTNKIEREREREREREKKQANLIRETEIMIAEIEMLKVVLYLVNRDISSKFWAFMRADILFI
jgi:hypothetical protein